jgi:serine/threonine-protein kinase
VAKYRKSVPPNVAAAVMQSLEKLPADRFETARAFGDALGDPAFGTREGRGRHVTTSEPEGSVSRVLFGTTAAVAALAISAAIWLATHTSAPPPRAVLRATLELPDSVDLITAGFGSRIAISPDGSKLVFAGRHTGSPSDATPLARRLYVRRRDQLTATVLPGTELATAPFFSPDGDRVGYLTRGPVIVKAVGFDGTPPVTIAEGGVDNSGMSWGPGGALYGSSNGRLVRLSISGGTPTPVSTLNAAAGEVGHVSPNALPNGRGVIFAISHRPSNVNALRDIAVLDLATLKHTILFRGVLARYAPPGYLVFVRADGTLAAAPFDQDKLAVTGPAIPLATGVAVPAFGVADLTLGADGTLVYVPGESVDAVAEVVWMTRDGVAKPVDAAWHANVQNIALSPDGSRLAVSIAGASGQEDIWIKQLGSGQLSRLTLGESRARGPVWLPDGNSVAYVSEEKAPFSLAAKAADGTGAVRVLASESRSIAEGAVSHDGQWVLYRTSSSDSGRGDIVAKRIGDSTTIPLLATGTDERHPTLSPDGRWLAYRSLESGAPEVYVRPFPNVADHKWQVSVNGGSDPHWAHSGKELFYIDAANHMVAVSVATQPTFAIRDQRVLFPVPPDVRLNATKQFYDVSSDDQRFLMIRSLTSSGRSGHTALVVVENWLEEVRARVRAGAPR